jgi:hypothetical protein
MRNYKSWNKLYIKTKWWFVLSNVVAILGYIYLGTSYDMSMDAWAGLIFSSCILNIILFNFMRTVEHQRWLAESALRDDLVKETQYADYYGLDKRIRINLNNYGKN